MRGQVFVAVTALAAMMAFAQPASAQYRDYHDEHVARQEQCRDSRTNRAIGGAIIGGIAGALLGREVADRGVRGEGAVVGAVVGSVAGAGVGRATANCDTRVQGSYDPYYGQPDRRYGEGSYGEDDLRGGPYRESNYGRRGEQCQPGEIISRDRRGREYREQVMMCRGRDGVWRPQ